MAFSFELVSPERILFSGDVDAVILPGTEGEMTVLEGHAPVLTGLKTGFLVITDEPGAGRRILVRGGFAEINQRGLTVLAERAHQAGLPRTRQLSGAGSRQGRPGEETAHFRTAAGRACAARHARTEPFLFEALRAAHVNGEQADS